MAALLTGQIISEVDSDLENKVTERFGHDDRAPWLLREKLLVLLEELAKAIVGKRGDFVTIAASHVVVIDKGVDDGFFSRFDSSGE